jgi:DtxR family transcriptional regulator, Mn-dependent transcriptional regulator
VVEDEEALILYLHEKGLTPGTQLTVLAKEDEGKSDDQQEENFKVKVEGREVSIREPVAAKIWVTH